MTFPHSVYSAHRLSSWSFSSPTRCMGFTNSPPVDGKMLMQLLYHGELPTPPRFCFMVSLPRAPFTVRGSNFVELCNNFVYCGPATFHPLTAALYSSLFTQGGISLNSQMIFFHNRANYFYPGANAALSHGTLNQLTSRDGSKYSF